jgi:hypothetical protein
MKAIELKMPDDTYHKLEGLASRDRQSVDAFALQKLQELIRAIDDLGELERRAKRGSRHKFEAAMAKVPDVPPMPGDELPASSREK